MAARAVAGVGLLFLVVGRRIERAVAHRARRVVHEARDHARVDEVYVVRHDDLPPAGAPALLKPVYALVVEDVRVSALESRRLVNTVVHDN